MSITQMQTAMKAIAVTRSIKDSLVSLRASMIFPILRVYQ